VSRPVSAADRGRDLVAVVIFLLGAALYGYGFIGLHGMTARPIVTRPGRTAVQQANIYSNVSRVGILLVAVALVAIVWSFWRHAARRPNSANVQENDS
jgi:hypothetical protein